MVVRSITLPLSGHNIQGQIIKSVAAQVAADHRRRTKKPRHFWQGISVLDWLGRDSEVDIYIKIGSNQAGFRQRNVGIVADLRHGQRFSTDHIDHGRPPGGNSILGYAQEVAAPVRNVGAWFVDALKGGHAARILRLGLLCVMTSCLCLLRHSLFSLSLNEIYWTDSTYMIGQTTLDSHFFTCIARVLVLIRQIPFDC